MKRLLAALLILALLPALLIGTLALASGSELYWTNVGATEIAASSQQVGIDAATLVGQQFTTTAGDTVGSVSIYAERNYSDSVPGYVTAHLKAVDGSGFPTGYDLAYGTVNANGWSTTYAWQEVAFHQAVTLTTSTKYVIYFSSQASNWHNSIMWPVYLGTDDTYTGGTGISYNGSSWSNEDHDFGMKIFGSEAMTLVTPVFPSPPPLGVLTNTTVFLYGQVVNYDASLPFVNVGFRYGPTAGYGSTSAFVTVTASGFYTMTLTGLSPGTTYHYCAVNQGDTLEGVDRTFTTYGAGTGATPLPTDARTSTQVKTISSETAPAGSYDGQAIKLNGLLVSTGGRASTAVGFAIGSGVDSLMMPFYSHDMNAPGDFNAVIEHLEPETTYYFKAVASGNTLAAGEIMNFTTAAGSHPSKPIVLVPPSSPVMITLAADNITNTSADLHGSTISLSGADQITIGFEIGTTTAYAAGQYVAGTTDSGGSYTYHMVGLVPNSTYHFRAVGISVFNGYGGDSSFSTASNAGGGSSGGTPEGWTDWLSAHGWGSQGAHWIITLILMAIVAGAAIILVPPSRRGDRTMGGIIAVVGVFMVLGIAITIHFLDLIIFLVLGTIAAFIIAGLVVKVISGRQSTG